MPKVNPEILIWARESAGLSVDEATKKLSLKDARGLSAAERLHELENGGQEPTRPMLVKMAKQYRRPLLAFYLPEPPREGDRGEDFRTLPESVEPSDNALVDALIRDVRARQKMVSTILEDDDDLTPVSFVGSKNASDGIQAVKDSIVTLLKLNIDKFRSSNSSDSAFTYLREQAEKAGIFVLLIGNLGSHHSAMEPDIFRGLALADNYAPFIVVNDLDNRSAWSFTLLHELTHLILGQTGVSSVNGERGIEKFCNDVAGEILLPRAELAGIPLEPDTGFEIAKALIAEFATARNISSTMVAYKLFRSGEISESRWKSLTSAYRQDYLNSRNAKRARSREKDGGPNYYIVRRHRIGSALIGLVARSLAGGEITTAKAGKVLGLKPKSVEPLLRGSQSSQAGLA